MVSVFLVSFICLILCGLCAYIAERGLPSEPLKTFREKAGWVVPVFPSDDKLELKDGIIQAELDARRVESLEEDLSKDIEQAVKKGAGKSVRKRSAPPNRRLPELYGKVQISKGQKSPHAQPVVDPENTGVKIVDLPATEEENNTSIGTTLLALFACLLLMAAIAIVILKKKKKDAMAAASGRGGGETASVQEKAKAGKTEKTDKGSESGKSDMNKATQIMLPDSDSSQPVSSTDDESANPLLK